jgi:hypothetical protein
MDDGLFLEAMGRFTQHILTAVSEMMVACRPIGEVITVDDRCKQRWPAATKKNRRRVRDVAVAKHSERLGRHPLKLTGAPNGTFAFERDHLDILDLAIDTVKAEAEARETMPLFKQK